jgi:hypothetical protein
MAALVSLEIVIKSTHMAALVNLAIVIKPTLLENPHDVNDNSFRNRGKLSYFNNDNPIMLMKASVARLQ